MKGAWNRESTRTSEEYIVRFDNRAAHRCGSLCEAVEFGRRMRGTGQYGRPTEVYKVTTKVSKARELVSTFDIVADEHVEDRDFEGFAL